VRAWIFFDADDGVFSFRAICDALEVDPEVIRKALTRRQERALAAEEGRIFRRSAQRTKRLSA
jgi:hypothetical protein